MKIVGPLIFLALILMGIFTLFNWSVLGAPADLSFIVFDLTAPLGFVLLGVIIGFIALFTTYVLALRTAMLMDARHYARELEAQQKLAEQAEASRLAELRTEIAREFARLNEAADKSRTDLNIRIEGLETALRETIEESARSLSAYVGEVDDKLDRSLGPAAGTRDA